MPASPAPVGRVIPANQWTQVEWWTGTFPLKVTYTAPSGVLIEWRWFSVGIPPYWHGQFSRIAEIHLPAGFYTSLEFKAPADTVISRYAG